MREIKFRGKTPEGKWIYGGISINEDRVWIDQEYLGDTFVDKETIGQYTGLKDKNGKEVYEGDILQLADTKMEVFWGEHIGIGYGFCWRNIKGKNEYHESITGFIDEYEVIGNVWDNKDLLKESE